MNKIFLSRRNLLTLLSKLDRRAKGEETTATIIKTRNPDDPVEFLHTLPEFAVVGVETIDEDDLHVFGVEDEEFYQRREAGLVLFADDPALQPIEYPEIMDYPDTERMPLRK